VPGEEHPDTLWSANNLGQVLRYQMKFKEAEAMHRQTLELREMLHGRAHPDTLQSIHNLALVLEDGGMLTNCELVTRLTLEQ
jgi:hypothetical protein